MMIKSSHTRYITVVLLIDEGVCYINYSYINYIYNVCERRNIACTVHGKTFIGWSCNVQNTAYKQRLMSVCVPNQFFAQLL